MEMRKAHSRFNLLNLSSGSILILFSLALCLWVLPTRAEDRKKSWPVETGLAKPTLLEVSGLKETDTSLFPFVGDFDGDGRQQLLLGAPGGGKGDFLGREDGRLRIFRKAGTAENPRLDAPGWFDDLAPTGAIPHG
jgi:hypothetical protein